MKILETERLHLRWLTPDDAAFMLGLLNEPSFIDNIGDRGVRTLEGAREYIAKGALASYEQNGYGLYMVELKSDGAAAGICGLVKRPFLADADVGFAFLPAYWSHGYAYESAAAVMRYAREEIGLERVVAIVSPGNGPSIRLLRKLGLEYDRTIALPDSGEECALFAPQASQEPGC
jgi:RimJ/RimL family protein N-acetyltransferase